MGGLSLEEYYQIDWQQDEISAHITMEVRVYLNLYFEGWVARNGIIN